MVAVWHKYGTLLPILRFWYEGNTRWQHVHACFWYAIARVFDLNPYQLAQLEDMVILVRGKLSNSARTTVGALTVIDVHARDVMIKLAYEKVAEK